MDPLLKWPGGKRRELGIILPLVPEHVRVVEPFAGGAAVSLSLEPADLWLNDIEDKLIDFYERLGAAKPATAQRFRDLGKAWDIVGEEATALSGPIESKSIDAATAAQMFSQRMAAAPAPFDDVAALRVLAEKLINDKRGRLVGLGKKKAVPQADQIVQYATALHAAFYTWMRDVFAPTDPDALCVSWWFIRELCYGSMFRYNAEGKFNIPYGGASYNNKDLASKIERLLASDISTLFGRARLTALDFRTFWQAYGGGRSDDFLFLDPPYDTEFSDYANRPFGRNDQIDLANLISASPAQTMLIIKRTTFIEDLYSRMAASDSRFVVALYDHKYGYNVRGRNERSVDHLMITTYSPV